MWMCVFVCVFFTMYQFRYSPRHYDYIDYPYSVSVSILLLLLLLLLPYSFSASVLWPFPQAINYIFVFVLCTRCVFFGCFFFHLFFSFFSAVSWHSENIFQFHRWIIIIVVVVVVLLVPVAVLFLFIILHSSFVWFPLFWLHFYGFMYHSWLVF